MAEKKTTNYTNGIIRMDSKNTTYLIRITETGHLENLYYGRKLRKDASIPALFPAKDPTLGNCVGYSEENRKLFLETRCFETSTPGKGDFRSPAAVIEYENGMQTLDFVYKEHRIVSGKQPTPGLVAQSVAEKNEAVTFQIRLTDKVLPIIMQINYTVFYECDVIARSVILTNETNETITIRNLASLQLDLPDSNWDILSLDGAWARERYATKRHLEAGKTILDSNVGVSSSYHNPCIFLCRPDCTPNTGDCCAFNLIYSGNHREVIEKSPFGLTRFQTGINPDTFTWNLKPRFSFASPEAIMTFSSEGDNTASNNFHQFINNHIVRGTWKFRERPVLCNNWEATYFNFTEEKILSLAKASADLGVELFVLDDGWFGDRNDGTSSLGDWFVNTEKLPNGLTALSDKIHKMGLLFGIWIEPEMVSRRSVLFTEHPDWAMIIPDRNPSVGRNQFILDLTRKEVQDYIVNAISEVILLSKADYIKWDMNRKFSDIHSVSRNFTGEFCHRYVMGLYDIAARIQSRFPKVLMEGCSAGGNRFDLGMLCFFPQIWTSDNTDAFCRTRIQSGTSYGYPVTAMGAHVSASPNHQTKRITNIETRFNVAAFGNFGYEMDLSSLSPNEKAAVRNQIDFYKKHRSLLQYGRFYRITDGSDANSNSTRWAITNTDCSEIMVLDFKTLNEANTLSDTLRIPFARPDFDYKYCSRQQSNVQDIESGMISGDVLAYNGLKLNPMNDGDFASRMYYFFRVLK